MFVFLSFISQIHFTFKFLSQLHPFIAGGHHIAQAFHHCTELSSLTGGPTHSKGGVLMKRLIPKQGFKDLQMTSKNLKNISYLQLGLQR